MPQQQQEQHNNRRAAARVLVRSCSLCRRTSFTHHRRRPTATPRPKPTAPGPCIFMTSQPRLTQCITSSRPTRPSPSISRCDVACPSICSQTRDVKREGQYICGLVHLGMGGWMACIRVCARQSCVMLDVCRHATRHIAYTSPTTEMSEWCSIAQQWRECDLQTGVALRTVMCLTCGSQAIRTRSQSTVM